MKNKISSEHISVAKKKDLFKQQSISFPILLYNSHLSLRELLNAWSFFITSCVEVRIIARILQIW